MAIEIPNNFEAAGIFDGGDPPINEDPIFSSNGVLPFNPAGAPEDPGGFLRIDTSDYLVGLERSIDFREGVVFITCLPGKPSPEFCAAIGAPLPDDSGDGTVVVIGNGANDALFYLGIFRFRTGADGTQDVPVAPPP